MTHAPIDRRHPLTRAALPLALFLAAAAVRADQPGAKPDKEESRRSSWPSRWPLRALSSAGPPRTSRGRWSSRRPRFSAATCCWPCRCRRRPSSRKTGPCACSSGGTCRKSRRSRILESAVVLHEAEGDRPRPVAAARPGGADQHEGEGGRQGARAPARGDVGPDAVRPGDGGGAGDVRPLAAGHVVPAGLEGVAHPGDGPAGAQGGRRAEHRLAAVRRDGRPARRRLLPLGQRGRQRRDDAETGRSAGVDLQEAAGNRPRRRPPAPCWRTSSSRCSRRGRKRSWPDWRPRPTARRTR